MCELLTNPLLGHSVTARGEQYCNWHRNKLLFMMFIGLKASIHDAIWPDRSGRIRSDWIVDVLILVCPTDWWQVGWRPSSVWFSDRPIWSDKTRLHRGCGDHEIKRQLRPWHRREKMNSFVTEKQFWAEFIELYRQNECLWRIRSKDYLNKLKKNEAYELGAYLCPFSQCMGWQLTGAPGRYHDPFLNNWTSHLIQVLALLIVKCEKTFVSLIASLYSIFCVFSFWCLLISRRRFPVTIVLHSREPSRKPHRPSSCYQLTYLEMRSDR